MRQIVLDTETTGLEPSQGHRIIEIGCVELFDRRPTGNNFHQYLQPDRRIDPGAIEVHGITDEFLADKPRFHDIVEDLVAYLKGAELVIHNAPFDVGFINHELALLQGGHPALEEFCTVTDTLMMARRMHPGQRNSLDALCGRYEIDNTRREKHGALLDAEILADVYLAMTGGQVDLGLSLEARPAHGAQETSRADRERPALRVLRASDAERQNHEQRLAAIEKSSGKCLWLEIEGRSASRG